jgi:hypothetical protein
VLTQWRKPAHFADGRDWHFSDPAWRPPQGDVELMTEKKVLGLKPAPRLQHVGDEYSERAQDRKHRSE